MKTVAKLLTCLLIAFWVIVIAIVSAQNGEPVSLRFLSYQSIQIPFGLLLAFSAGLGVIGMAVVQTLWNLAGSGRGNSISNEDPEFFTDEDY
ncbi:MAG: LapA family protein [Calothrix sp. C42_A2020_038]|nr:LapA family protein [Calothrix sp. C42_A2020_038]